MSMQDTGSQDTGVGILDTGAGGERGPLNPVSRILDPEAERRLMWRCRRGLLELDIVLGRFVQDRYPAMDEAQRAVFDELLDLPDTELWDAITGKREPAHAQQRPLLEWLKQA